MAALIVTSAIVGLFFAGFGCGWHGRGEADRGRRGGMLR
jgi:hypothetical protein